jgi:hypothetical protein
MYSKGISWIDDCRIPFVDEKILIKGYETNAMDIWYEKDKGKLLEPKLNTTGRFPANLLVSDDMLNDGVISKSGNGKSNTYDKNWIHYGGKYKQRRNADIGDKGTNSRYYDIDKWFDNLIDV